MMGKWCRQSYGTRKGRSRDRFRNDLADIFPTQTEIFPSNTQISDGFPSDIIIDRGVFMRYNIYIRYRTFHLISAKKEEYRIVNRGKRRERQRTRGKDRERKTVFARRSEKKRLSGKGGRGREKGGRIRERWKRVERYFHYLIREFNPFWWWGGIKKYKKKNPLGRGESNKRKKLFLWEKKMRWWCFFTLVFFVQGDFSIPLYHWDC